MVCVVRDTIILGFNEMFPDKMVVIVPPESQLLLTNSPLASMHLQCFGVQLRGCYVCG